MSFILVNKLNHLSEKSFSTLHFNIRSLSANYEAFAEMLSDMNHSFPIIGLSETKIKAGVAQYVNIDLPGYEFLSQPTFSNAGGVGFHTKRDDLCCTQHEFESLWVEIEVPHQHNITCGVPGYRKN